MDFQINWFVVGLVSFLVGLVAKIVLWRLSKDDKDIDDANNIAN